ncbi:MAG: DUF4091 domain-containing protein [Firmicutes bacterium]|nr:DUF4091 domain-containing protein [Bacillota bacterium]
MKKATIPAGRGILGILLAIALLLPLAGTAKAAVIPDIAVYGFTYSTQKRYRWEEIRTFPESGALNLARNEREAIEFLWREKGKAAREIRIEVADFVNGRGGSMKPEVYTMYYFQNDNPEWGDPREEPDPLIPYDGGTIAVTKNVNQYFFIEIRSDRNQPPGEYTSSLRVYEGDTRLAECPITATVWNFALPEARYSDTAFEIGTWRDSFYELNGIDLENTAEKEACRKQYYDYLLDYGISPMSLPYPVDDPRAEAYIRDPRAKTFALSAGGTAQDIKTRYDKVQALGAGDKAYFYPVDEPDSGADVRAYNNWLSILRGAVGDGFHMVTPFYTLRFNEDGTSVEAGDPPGIYSDEPGDYNNLDMQNGNSDIICPISALFTKEQHPDFAGQLSAMKDNIYKLWWYVCCGPWVPWCNFNFVDRLAPRVLFWQQYQNDVDGVLYWDTVFWYRKVRRQEVVISEGFADPWRSNGRIGFNGAGDGLLLYPGHSYPDPARAKNEPFPSIRLKNISDGLDDFDYLKMYEELFGREKADAIFVKYAVSASMTEHLWEDNNSLVALAEARKEIGQALSDYYTSDFAFGLVSSSEQFRLKYIDNSGTPVARDVPLAMDYALTLAQNEREGFQAAYRELGRERRSIRLEVSDFVHASGADTLAPEVFREAFFSYEYQEGDTAKASLDSYADALVPYSGEALAAEKDRYVPFYIELRSDKDSLPGIYTAAVTIYDADSGEMLSQAQATAEVWSFALPEGRYCQTAFGNHDNGKWYLGANGFTWEDAAAWPIAKGWYDCLLDHGISGYELPVNVLENPRAAQEYLTDPRVTSALVPWGTSLAQLENVHSYHEAFAQQPLWERKCYFYPADEPWDVDAQRVGADVGRARTIWPGLSMMIPFNETNNNPDSHAAIIGIMRQNNIDILCPNQFIIGTQYDLIKDTGAEWKAAGKRVWTYPYRNQYPSFELVAEPGYAQWYKGEYTLPEVWFSTGPQRRAVFWQQYQSGYDGVLYWQTAYWNRAGEAYNPWAANMLPQAGTLSWDVRCGNAQLIYPSAPIGLDPAQPVVSLRLKQIADGLEDFDYLTLAEEFLGRDFALRALNETGTQMAYRDNDTYFNFTFQSFVPSRPGVGYTQDIADVEAMRRRIGEALSAANTEHKWGEWESVLPSDSEHEGIAVRTCRGCGTQESRRIEVSPDFAFGFELPTIMVMQDDPAPQAQAWDIRLARNEREGLQFLYKEQKQPEREIRVTVDGLKNGSGSVLVPEVFQTVYILNRDDIVGMDGYSGDGRYYPDALLPLEGKSVQAKRGLNTAFYFEVRTDAATPAGIYSGNVHVWDAASGRELLTAPISATVWDFSLPEGHYSENMFPISYPGDNYVAQMFRLNGVASPPWGTTTLEKHPEAEALYASYFEYMLDQGFSPAALPYDVLDPRADVLMSDPRLKNFCLATNSIYSPALSKVRDKIKSNPGWERKAMFYAPSGDMPDLLNPEKEKSFKKAMETLLETWPGAHTIIPFLSSDMLRYMDILVVGGNDIVCPFLAYYKEPLIKTRANQWGRDWWYIGGAPETKHAKHTGCGVDGCTGNGDKPIAEWFRSGNSTANIFLGAHGAEARSLFWQQYYNGVDGLFYWNTACWCYDDTYYKQREMWEYVGKGYDERGPWGGMIGSGDGQLLYPGLPVSRDPNTPIASLRLKSLAEGLDDYDYLMLAKEFLGDSFAENVVSSLKNGAAWTFWPADLHRTGSINRTRAEQMNNARNALGEALSAANTEHAWGEWQTVVTPTAEREGMDLRSCTTCGTQESRKLPKSHAHSYVGVTTPPTCTAQGFTTYTCAEDGDSYVAGYVDALGHDWGAWATTTSATEDAEGVENRVCKRDAGHSETRVVPMPPQSAPAIIGDKNVTLDYRGEKQLGGSVTGSGLTWSSSNTKYVAVDPSTGKITSPRSFIKTGSATITARNSAGQVELSVKVKPTIWQWLVIIFLFGWIWY